MKQHSRPPLVLALLLLDLLAGVIGGLVPFDFHHIPAAEVITNFLAAMAGKTFEVQRGISLLVDGDRNRFLLHDDLPPRDKLESHLLSSEVSMTSALSGVSLRRAMAKVCFSL